MADAKKETTEQGAEKAKGGLLENKVVLLGGIVVVQVALAIGLTQFLIVPKLGVSGADVAGEEKVAEEMELPEMGVLLGLEEIIVTLRSNPDRPRYLRININLELKDQLSADMVGTRLPQLRDIVIMALSDKSPDDLSAPEGKKALRDEIFRKIDERMPPGILLNIYFSDLVVQ